MKRGFGIKCVVFDLGGVLLKARIEAVHKKLNKKIGLDLFQKDHILHKNLLTGNMTEKEFYNDLSKKSGVPPEKLRKMQDREYSKEMKLNRQVIQIAKNLRKKGYKTGIISNITPDHKKRVKKMDFFQHFNTIILSSDIGAIKPDSRIFTAFLKKSHAKPDECVFIDDREKLLKGARKAGMKTIHFRNPRQLAADLRKMDVKI